MSLACAGFYAPYIVALEFLKLVQVVIIVVINKYSDTEKVGIEQVENAIFDQT